MQRDRVIAKIGWLGVAKHQGIGPVPAPEPPQRSPLLLITPNAFAWLMLLLWPLVVLVLYRRLPADKALIWAVLGGYLLLPPGIALNLPLVPDLGKDSIPVLMAAAMAVLVLRDRVSLLPQNPLGRVLMALFVLSPFATVLTNGDAMARGPGVIQGMRLYDSVAAVANQAIALLPFFLGRRYLAGPDAMRHMLVALMAAGLAYSVPMLIEVRLSPQMNAWIYGYFQHDFSQTMRFGGFRPVVFLPHGLWVAFFAMMALIAALTLARASPKDRRPKLVFATLYLAAVLVLCKSAGPLVYAVGLSLLILVMPRRGQVIVAAVLAVMVVSYPLLRGAQLIPIEAIVEFAKGLSPDRASSLQFRITNEEALLDRANLKAWFGWGGYGRNLIYDPLTGAGLSIADGAWIITMGIYGWLGYIAQFGLLALPLLLMGRRALLRRGEEVSAYAAAVCLILAANLVDMLPNATLIPFTWLMAGAVLGHAEGRVQGWAGQTPAPGGAARLPKPRRTVL